MLTRSKRQPEDRSVSESTAPTDTEADTKAEISPDTTLEPEAPVIPISSAAEELEAMFNALGIDKNSEVFDKTLRSYETVKIQVTLEDPQRNWLACCLYTTVWSSCAVIMKPSVTLSVTSLIEICGLSVMEFFDNLEKWAILMNAPTRLYDHIERVQANLSVSIVVFDKFLPIFRQIFVPNQHAALIDPPSERKFTVTTFKIFEYIWVVYCAFKKQLQKGAEDLLNSFHLLLIVIDLVVADLIDREQNHFINKPFLAELAASDKTALNYFCERYNGVALDAKHFRSHWFYTQANAFFEAGLLKMKMETYSELLDNINFNIEYLNSVYDEAIYDRLEVDERIFVNRIEKDMVFDEEIDLGIVVGIRPLPDGTFSRNGQLLAKKASEQSLNNVNISRCMRTPLSGKAYLSNSEVLCPVGNNSEMSRVEKLESLIETADEQISEIYEELMKKFNGEATENLLTQLNETLIARVRAEHQSSPHFDSEFSKDVEGHAQSVYQLLIRFLQRITVAEHQRLVNPATTVECLAGVYQRPEFITSLWVCCLEIVLFSYSSAREFPWSVEVAGISPLAFYKIIEPVIRSDGDLSREILKHLSKIEERVLEELAWEKTSPLWKSLTDSNSMPSYDEVMLPEKVEVVPPRSMPPLQANIISRYGIAGKAHAKRRLDYDEGEFEPPAKKASGRGKASNTLVIFARKLYYLAALHMNDLCDRVRMDERGRRRVWTLFEHIVRSETSLMRGRHIDQNIMCCLYIISKVSNMNIAFHEILYHYRHQPQAASRIYRNVLIAFTNSPAPAGSADDGASRDSVSSVSQHSGAAIMRSASTMPAPGMQSAPPTPEPPHAEYNDLITYYNRVFVKKVEDFVKRLAFPDETNAKIPLLSVPAVRCNTLSPRRAITPNLSVTPLGSVSAPLTPNRPMRFNVNRSPSKDLHQINAVVRGQPYRLAQY